MWDWFRSFDWLQSGEILLRSLASITTLFILTKIMGFKQISQLTFFDYIIGISIGSIAGEMAFAADTPVIDCVFAMAIYGLIATGISYWNCKSYKARKFFNGTPIILMDKGKIYEKNMMRAKYDLGDLTAECRHAGYFDLSDVYSIVMETSGHLSILPKEGNRPVTTKDLKLLPQQQQLVANIIIDGRLIPGNLKQMGKDETWLKGELKKQKFNSYSEILLGTLNIDGVFTAYPYQNHEFKQTLFV